MGEHVPPLSIKADPLVRIIATPPAEADRLTRVLCQEVSILSAADANKIAVTVDIGPLIEAAVRSGLDEYEYENVENMTTGRLATVEARQMEGGGEYIQINAPTIAPDGPPLTVYLNGYTLYHGRPNSEVGESLKRIESDSEFWFNLSYEETQP